MIFGEFKCTFLAIDKGKVVVSHEAIVMNGVTILIVIDRHFNQHFNGLKSH